MSPRLCACLVVVAFVLGSLASVSSKVLAQAGQPSQHQQTSAPERNRPGSQFSQEIDKALQAYEQHMGGNVEECRKELDRMKKELHELIDLRIQMAISLAELRDKVQPQGPGPGIPGGFPPGYYTTRGYTGVSGGPSGGGGQAQRSPGENQRQGRTSTLASELLQLHNQLRNEVDQEKNQLAQLAGQLRALEQQEPAKGQGPQGNQPPGSNQGRSSQPSANQGQAGRPSR